MTEKPEKIHVAPGMTWVVDDPANHVRPVVVTRNDDGPHYGPDFDMGAAHREGYVRSMVEIYALMLAYVLVIAILVVLGLTLLVWIR